MAGKKQSLCEDSMGSVKTQCVGGLDQISVLEPFSLVSSIDSSDLRV